MDRLIWLFLGVLLLLPLSLPLLNTPELLFNSLPFLLYIREFSIELCELCLLIILEPFLLPILEVILDVISENFSISFGLS